MPFLWLCRHVCPYHASRDVLTEGAALIFVTYAQLLDPPVRSANGLDDLLPGAAVIFDEVSIHSHANWTVTGVKIDFVYFVQIHDLSETDIF